MGVARCNSLYGFALALVSVHLVISMNEEVYANNVYDECEVHHNCTVEIWKNSKTGEVSIGWYEDGNEKTEQ